jgi:hypothetical protein
MRLRDEVAIILKPYVQVYSDPKDGKQFSIGKGQSPM